MKCEKCKAEGYIMDRGPLTAELDAEGGVKNFYLFSYGCRNPKCENNKRHAIIGEKKVYIG